MHFFSFLIGVVIFFLFFIIAFSFPKGTHYRTIFLSISFLSSMVLGFSSLFIEGFETIITSWELATIFGILSLTSILLLIENAFFSIKRGIKLTEEE